VANDKVKLIRGRPWRFEGNYGVAHLGISRSQS